MEYKINLMRAFSLAMILSVSACGGGGGGGGGSSPTTTQPTSSFSSEPSVSSSASSVFVGILVPDTSLQTAIAAALKIEAPAQLQIADLEKLTTLELTYLQPVNSLEGLQYAKNLETLQIQLGSYNDLKPLSGLTKLTSLKLSAEVPLKLEQITKLTQLTTLLVEGSDVNNVAYFEIALLNNFIHLKQLSIVHAGLTSIPSFSALTQLEELDLTGNKITDLSSLQANRLAIESLVLTQNPVQNIEALNGANRFRKLDLSGTQVTSIAPVIGMINGKLGDELIAVASCLSTEKFSMSYAQTEALRSAGMVITVASRRPTEILWYNRLTCPNALADAKIILTAEDVGTDSLLLNWEITGVSNDFLGICKIYFNATKQVLNNAFTTHGNCPQKGSLTLSGLAYLPETISLRFSDGYNPSIQQNYTLPARPTTLTKPTIVGVQWGQTVVKENLKLVPNKSALIRVVVKADSELNPPVLRIDIKNNNSTQTLPLEANQFETDQVTGKVTVFYSAITPKTWMIPDVKFDITLAENPTVTVEPVFAKPSTLSISIIPIFIDGVLPQLPPLTDIENTITGFWPLSAVKAKLHPQYTTKGDSYSLIFEIEDLRVIEGNNVYYLGFFNPENKPTFTGLAFALGSKTSITNEFFQSGSPLYGHLLFWQSTMLHELGHNFGRNHVNCGEPADYDTAYPYDTRTMGSLGISADLSVLYSPKIFEAGYSDIMSYCSIQHVSDYNYEAVQDYIELNPPQPFKADAIQGLQKPANPNERSLYLSGEIQTNGNTTIRRLVPLNRGIDADATSDYIVKGSFTNGVSFERHAAVPVVDHPSANMAQNFYATLPYGEIATLRLVHNGRVLFLQENTAATKTLQKNAQKITATSKPTVTQQGKYICLDWPAEAHASASLIHQGEAETTALILDDESGHYCLEVDSLNAGGKWQVLIRQGLTVQEFILKR